MSRGPTTLGFYSRRRWHTFVVRRRSTSSGNPSNEGMKSVRLLLLILALLVVSSRVAGARAVRIWSYQELLDKSDLVVLATPATTNDTKEHIDLPGLGGEQVIAVEIKFSISIVLKGDKALRNFMLHLYRSSHGTNLSHIPNGPSFVSFAPGEGPQRTYILFLLRQDDGRYAPVVGQWDPGLAIKELVTAAR